MFSYFGDCLRDVVEFVGAVGSEGFDVGERANGVVHHGAFAVNELKVEAHGGEREQKVGEDDGGVDAEALGGGDCDLGGDCWGAADFEQGVVTPDRHVFGHVAAGLAQKPDGGAVHGLTKTGTDETAASLPCVVRFL